MRLVHNLQENFLSRQTKQDVLIACNNILLAIKLLRLYAEAEMVLEFEPGRLSSRYCEYTFQAFRAATRTSNKFTVLGGVRLLHNYAAELELEATTSLPQVEISLSPSCPGPFCEVWICLTRIGHLCPACWQPCAD